MSRGECRRHEREVPCGCAMGNLYRFIEPIVLFLLRKKGVVHGYDLMRELTSHSLTDNQVDKAGLYRTLRTLEQNGNVVSEWGKPQKGPARRYYRLTPKGVQHLDEWRVVLKGMAEAMTTFVEDVRVVQESTGGNAALEKGELSVSRKTQLVAPVAGGQG